MFQVTNAIVNPTTWDLHKRYSTWKKLVRIAALIMRFVKRLRGDIDSARVPCELFPEDLRLAKLVWIKQLQSAVFYNEITFLRKSGIVSSSSAIAPFIPYLDTDGIV